MDPAASPAGPQQKPILSRFTTAPAGDISPHDHSRDSSPHSAHSSGSRSRSSSLRRLSFGSVKEDVTGIIDSPLSRWDPALLLALRVGIRLSWPLQPLADRHPTQGSRNLSSIPNRHHHPTTRPTSLHPSPPRLTCSTPRTSAARAAASWAGSRSVWAAGASARATPTSSCWEGATPEAGRGRPRTSAPI